ARIARWRLKQALGRTWLRRPELLASRGMNGDEAKLLEEFKQERKASTPGEQALGEQSLGDQSLGD
ncbi:MAG TPA: hypothetical protein VFF44_11355, partial [Casimicrobiaceae bacterium]|nr:hypothetical protein [Casimicrobiaceae bacterium]